jgi:hypothetical protein
MKLSHARWAGVLVSCTAGVAVEAKWNAGNAEYAVHWNPAEGGPASLDAVKKLPTLSNVTTKSFKVEVYSVKQPIVRPLEVQIIARERTTDNNVESSYKLRADVPLDLLVPEVSLACPFQSATWNLETDVMWGPSMDVAASAPMPDPLPTRIRFLRTCTVDLPVRKALPVSYEAKEPECTSSVIRYKGVTKDKDIKVEQWNLDSDRMLLEVSMEVVKDSVARRNDFTASVVAPLIAAVARPSASAKTEISRCP